MSHMFNRRHVYQHGIMTQRHPIRNNVPMLITTNTVYRYPFFIDEAYAREAVEALYRTKTHKHFEMYGFVIMPDHCHILLHVASPESISNVLFTCKRSVSFVVGKSIWQKRFHIRIPNNLRRALQYIHQNPVRAGLVEYPQRYPWSSASGRWEVSPLPNKH